MKATQIRLHLVAPMLAAVLGLGANMAFADTLTPMGVPISVGLCSGSKLIIKLGTATVTCNTSTTTAPPPNPNPTAPGTPVCGQVNAPTLGSCTVSSFGVSFAATCTAAGTWNLCLTPTTAQLTGGTVNCTANVLGQTCRANSAAVSFSGTLNNASSSATFTNQTVSVTTSGGFPCPSGNSATFSATYCTTPAITVTDP